MTDLIARLEALTGPDREVDVLIFKHLHFEYGSEWVWHDQAAAER